ncbi:MAG: hypothetical protein QM496_02465, partial [Verrucomicrobiota bacterium]
MFRKLGYILIVLGVLAAGFHLADIRFPSLKWFFSWREAAGWAMSSVLILGGALMAWFAPGNVTFSPETQRQMQRFVSIRRGYVSLCLLGLLVLFAMMDNLLVGKRALVVRYEGGMYFPVFRDAYPATTFGGEEENETNYRDLKKRFASEGQGNWVCLPLVPWGATLDSDGEKRAVLEKGKDGLYRLEGRRDVYSGIASAYYPGDKGGEELKHTEWRFRQGQMDGTMTLWNQDGEVVQRGQWEKGELVEEGVKDAKGLEAIKGADVSPISVTLYPPLRPTLKDRHFMGTDTGGNDILAQLFGGWQILLQANVIYLTITYAIG